ncbi:Vesicle-associated membrane protein [Sesamum angolense]|uniref:Vesicle-associated membrane protein n=1 Tax=Sesamum angolense TaxID=2727404 RepID=A0AAE1W8D5_9LAMI|nr:Vesicle-associated membrane protein [Sesamum angolense]
MAILYALVARGSVCWRNSALPPPPRMRSRVKFSRKSPGTMTLMLPTPRIGRIPFAFLEEIHQRFVRTYGRAVLSAQAYAMNDEFSRVLSQQMEYFSNDPNADRYNRLRATLLYCFNFMFFTGIEELIKLGSFTLCELLLLITNKNLLGVIVGNTFRFRKQARRFRNTVWWRNVKLTVALILLLLVIVYIVLAFVCHGPALPSCL